MEQKLQRVFRQARYEDRENITQNIWQVIVAHEKRTARKKLIFTYTVDLLSLSLLVPVLKILINDLSKSGFYEYLSLTFSNGGIISSYWKEFMFSLAESLPIISIILTLTLVFIFCLSLRYTIKQITGNKLSLSF